MDHVKDYKPPKDSDDIDDVTKQLREQGCPPKVEEPASSESEDEQYVIPVKKAKKGDIIDCIISLQSTLVHSIIVI